MIPIKGVIGCDVLAVEFAEKLSRLRGDIDFEIDSPGGSVFDGISIFNSIQNYNRGKCNIKVTGDCSSIAAYIMLAGDTLKFESNAIVVLHNPWQVTIGDYRAMQSSALILEKLAALYAEKFVEKGIFKLDEIRQLMDDETWFVGANDLKQLGEVAGGDDETANNEDNVKEIKIAALKEKMLVCSRKVKALTKPEIDKIAALVCVAKYNTAVLTTDTGGGLQGSVNDFTNEAGAAMQNNITPQEKGEIIMNSQDQKNESLKDSTAYALKSQNAELYNEVVALGVQQERARVAAFMKFIDIDKDAVVNALKNGKEITDNEFQAAVLMAKVKKDMLSNMESDNNENVDPKAETHASENPEADDKIKAAEKEKEQLAKIVEMALA